jgi:outer membrane lipoprotein-sorting protein
MYHSRTNSLAGLAVILLISVCTGSEAQNKYDVLARTLQPFGSLFYSKSPTKAFQAEVVLRDGPASVSNFVNQSIRISLQMPNKLRIESLDPNHPIVLCRDGQRVWVYPRELAERILPAEGPPSGPSVRIPDFKIPVRDNEIPLLPVLFEVTRFESTSDPEGAPAWAIDFRPSPELLRQASEEWAMTVVVGQQDFKVRRIEIHGRTWSGTCDVLDIRFAQDLPPELWQPDRALADGATPIPPSLFISALEKISAITFSR